MNNLLANIFTDEGVKMFAVDFWGSNFILCCVVSGMCPGRLLAVRVKQAKMAYQILAQVAPSLLPWTIVEWLGWAAATATPVSARWSQPCGARRASFLHLRLLCHAPPTTRRRASSSASRTGSQHPRWWRW